MNLLSIVKSTFSAKVRTGTKIAGAWLFFSAVLIVWLLVGIPVLSIFYPHLMQLAPHLSAIIVSLIGGASVAYSANEARKTFENVKANKPVDKSAEQDKPPKDKECYS